ncbi:MAG: HEAT repeat domain-containing protein [Tepidisphaerales bacterium]
MAPGKLALVAVGSLIVCVLLAATAHGQEDPYTQALAYKFGDSRQALMKIEAEIRSAKLEQRAGIEGKLLAALNSPQATTDCRGWVCRQLRHVGSEQSIPHLVKLLGDKELATPARIALQSLPKCDQALREVLPKLEGDFKAGVVLTLGARGDVQALPLIAPLASDANANIAEAAIYALGQLATVEALDTLRKGTVPDALKRQRDDAILRCADRLLAGGKAADAAGVYAGVLKSTEHYATRVAALRGLVLAKRLGALSIVMVNLKSNESRVKLATCQILREVGGWELRAAVLAELSGLDPAVQATLLLSCNELPALVAALKAMESTDAALRAAAIETVGRLGGARQVPVLLQLAGKGGEDGRLAQAALARFKDAAADQALLDQLGKPQPAAAIAVLALRNNIKAMPALLKLGAACDDNAVAGELGRAYTTLGSPADLGELAKVLVGAKLPAMRTATAAAISSIAIRQNARNEAADVLAPALATAPGDLKPVILDLLGRVGGARALAAARGGLADAATHDAALRALAEWPDDSAAEDLLKLTGSAGGNNRVIAVRGYLRLAAKGAKERPAAQTLGMFKQAVPLTDRADEKRNLLARLAEVPANADLLNLAMSFLDDAAVKSEAAMASLTLAEGLVKANPKAAKEAAQRIRQLAISDAVNRRADQVLGKI